VVGNMIHNGNNSLIFKCVDTTKRNCGKLAIKIFEQGSVICNEIKTLMKLRKILKKKYEKDTLTLIPKICNIGSMVIKNEQNEKKLYFYAVMPRVEQDLVHYIEKSGFGFDHYDLLDVSI
jgi:hypothetical protein